MNDHEPTEEELQALFDAAMGSVGGLRAFIALLEYRFPDHPLLEQARRELRRLIDSDR